MLRAAAFVLPLVLAGCTVGPERATGLLVTGSAYTYRVPPNWGPPSEQPEGYYDSVAVDLADEQDVWVDKVAVFTLPASAATSHGIEERAKERLEAGGQSDVEVERVTVAGDSDVLHTSSVTPGSDLYDYGPTRVDSFHLFRGDQLFTLSFNFSTDVPLEDSAEVTDVVLSTWTWTD
ncbi:hypothetical protein [Nocardioides sp.]|uniref:hypothetical protein n=1 Tax=Nocardioides sp. TaxID=35761 RepID=UPI002BC7585A|nr:hypothetical protein [Nocardioides sp.]HXH80775.1 hypothetical protein [Nocardioides sp.]